MELSYYTVGVIRVFLLLITVFLTIQHMCCVNSLTIQKKKQHDMELRRRKKCMFEDQYKSFYGDVSSQDINDNESENCR